MIRVEINENDIRQSGKNGGVCGEGNSTEMEIVFVSGWNEYVKKVVFYDARGENPVIVLLTDGNRLVDKAEETYRIKIPSEPLRYEGKAEFVVDGSIDGARKKSVGGSFEVRYSPDSNVENLPEEVAQTVGEQLQQEIELIPKIGPFIGDNGNWFVYDVEKKTHIDTNIQAQGEKGPEGPRGEPGYTPQRGTDYWTEEDKQGIKGDIEPFVVETLYAEDAGDSWLVDKTYEETYEAYRNNREILLRHITSTFRLAVCDSGTFIFSCVRGFTDGSQDVSLATFKEHDSVVSFVDFPIESKDNKVSQITDEATYIQYPTVQAVKDYIDKTAVTLNGAQTINGFKAFLNGLKASSIVTEGIRLGGPDTNAAVMGEVVIMLRDDGALLIYSKHTDFNTGEISPKDVYVNDKKILTEEDAKSYVDLTSEQNIVGHKQFMSLVRMYDGLEVQNGQLVLLDSSRTLVAILKIDEKTGDFKIESTALEMLFNGNRVLTEVDLDSITENVIEALPTAEGVGF